jgi:hypothetical protein
MSSYDDVCAVSGTTATCWPLGSTETWVRTLAAPVTAVTLTVDARCGLTAAGEVVCDVGQCSSSTTCDDTNNWGTRVGTGPAGPWAQIEVADFAYAMCGRRATGEVECWGQGYDANIRASEPSGLRFADIGLGVSHVCGVTDGGHVICWGTDPMAAGVLDVPAELR